MVKHIPEGYLMKPLTPILECSQVLPCQRLVKLVTTTINHDSQTSVAGLMQHNKPKPSNHIIAKCNM